MKTTEFIDFENEFGARNYAPLDVVINRGEGVWVFDVEGRKYLDCISAYSAVNQGHVHPAILSTLVEQAGKLTLTGRAVRNDQLPMFYKELSEFTGYEMSLPMNSGAEAVETALKVARKWAYQDKGVVRHQAEVITAAGNFHGRTITAISFSSEPLYRDDFGPFTPGFTQVPFGDAHAIERSINRNTAAVLLEPIQGEGGVIIPPPGFLRDVSEICSQHNVLLIVDEIQTGLGRTGKLFAYEYENIRPDIVIIGKALGGGFYPISAILADRPILGLIQPGEHGSTFGGNPLAAAIARTSLQVIVEENLVSRSMEMGKYFLDRLTDIRSPHIKEVRGRGLLIGVEILESSGGARRFCEALLHRGILAKDTHENVVRFAPPLIISRETIDWAMEAITEVLRME